MKSSLEINEIIANIVLDKKYSDKSLNLYSAIRAVLPDLPTFAITQEQVPYIVNNGEWGVKVIRASKKPVVYIVVFEDLNKEDIVCDKAFLKCYGRKISLYQRLREKFSRRVIHEGL